MTQPLELATPLLAGVAVAALFRPVPRLPRRPAGAGPPPENSPGNRLPALGAVGVGLGVSLLIGGGLGLVAGIASAVAAWRLLNRMETPGARRRRERLERDLPHGVDLLAACLLAGKDPGAAVEDVTGALDDGPLRDELRHIATLLRLGADPPAVWRGVGRQPSLGALGRCVARALDSGVSVAEAMVRLADDQRRDARSRVEGRARSAGVKAAVPLGLCMLPAFILIGVVPMVVGSLTTLLSP
jgi:Flp pilus assembly protein TadB